MVHGRFVNGTHLEVIRAVCSTVLMNSYYANIPEPNAFVGCHVHVMAPMILDNLLIIACGIMVLLATVSAAQEEKRSTKQLKHAQLEHAQLISSDTTVTTAVSGARAHTHACMHARTIAR